MTLHEKINEIIDNDLAPQDALNSIRDFCDEHINNLGERLRINDIQGEGILYVGDRNMLVVDGLPSASVDRRNLDNEEGLSYALFNGRQNPVGDYQIISYESQLLRRTNREADGILTVKCDLVAYNAIQNNTIAVEVKLDPRSRDTNLQHGMLQSMAYGYLLQHSFNINTIGFGQQVRMCLNNWCGQNDNNDLNINSVHYALAAPKQYFQESLERYQDRTEWFRELIEIDAIQFSGFWVLEYDGIRSDTEDENHRCIPTADYQVTLLSNLEDLSQHFQNQNN